LLLVWIAFSAFSSTAIVTIYRLMECLIYYHDIPHSIASFLALLTILLASVNCTKGFYCDPYIRAYNVL
jgi:hypothetical protein